MLKYCFSFLLLVAFSWTPVWAVTLLNDSELTKVCGGGIEYSLDGQGTPQQPQKNSKLVLPQATEDGIDRMPSIMTAAGSSTKVNYRHDLLLDSESQQSVSILVLENVLVSDSVAATNIFGGKILVEESVIPILHLDQGSEIHQRYRQQGLFSSATDGYFHVTSTEIKDDYLQNKITLSSRIEQFDRQDNYSQALNSWNIGVDKIPRPQLQTGHVTYSLFAGWPDIYFIRPFNIDATADLGWFGKYGGSASYSGLKLTGPQVSYDGIEERGNDLLIAATLKLPELDFGDIAIEACIYECIEGNLDLKGIGGTNLFSILGDIDDHVAPDDIISFSEEGLVLKGMADTLPDELNLNSGFVFAGQGSFKSDGSARIRIGAELGFKLNSKLGYKVDLTSVDKLGLISGFFGKDEAIWEEVKEDQLIDLTVPIDFVNIEVPEFEVEFDGLILLQIGPGRTSINRMESASSESYLHDNSIFEQSVVEEVGESFFHYTTKHRSFVGGQLTEGQAELLAMSEGDLYILRGGDINLSDQAQSRIRALHAVNAVTSIAANSANVGTLPVSNRGVARISTQQHNKFVQHR